MRETLTVLLVLILSTGTLLAANWLGTEVDRERTVQVSQ